MNTAAEGPVADPPAGEGARRMHRALLLLPFVWQAALIPVVNEVAWQPWGLPFPMAWQMAGVVLTTVVIGIVYAIDLRIDARVDNPQGRRPEERVS